MQLRVFGGFWHLFGEKLLKMLNFRNRLLTIRLTSSEYIRLKEHIVGLNVSISSFFRTLLMKELESVSSGKMPVGKNAPCPCGSGKKYKKCCLNGVV